MEKRNNIINNYKKQRYAVSDVEKYLDTNSALDGKILVLFGLRRTGKTTIMEQIISKYSDSRKCALYEVTYKDNMDNIRDAIIKEREMGTNVICIDEITKAKDFITNSSILPDIFAKEGISIIVAGNDSLGFSFAEGTELFDRTVRVRTTHIPFAEHSEVLNIKDIDDYIMHGGLMRKSEAESNIHDYMSAKKYLDSAVSENIALSIEKDPHNNKLKTLSIQELRAIIEKMVEIYSGIFNKEQMQKELSKVSVNGALDLLAKSEYQDYIKTVSPYKRNITEDFTKVINADANISIEITDDMVLALENYLIDMDLLSAITRKEFRYTDELGWRESPAGKDFYIIQPAIKYYHLQKGKEFIENESYYQALPQSVKEEIQNKLDEKIKGDMVEQIIVFDTTKDLNKNQYFVCKPDFYVNGQKQGEYDMLIYDKQNNKYWGFEIKHTTKPFYLQEKHLQNEQIREIIDEKYGKRENVCVLYRGDPFVSSGGTVYLNISDFLIAVNKYKNMDLVMEKLTKELNSRDLYEKENNDLLSEAKGKLVESQNKKEEAQKSISSNINRIEKNIIKQTAKKKIDDFIR